MRKKGKVQCTNSFVYKMTAKRLQKDNQSVELYITHTETYTHTYTCAALYLVKL